RGDLGGQAGVAERVRADHQPERGTARQGRERGEGRPAFEDRLLPRADDGHQVIPRPETFDAHLIGANRGVADGCPRGRLWPEEDADLHLALALVPAHAVSFGRTSRPKVSIHSVWFRPTMWR